LETYSIDIITMGEPIVHLPSQLTKVLDTTSIIRRDKDLGKLVMITTDRPGGRSSITGSAASA